MALKPRNKIRHSQPLEGEDARRFVEDVDSKEATDKQREFRAQSKGVFRKVYSPRPANDLFPKQSPPHLAVQLARVELPVAEGLQEAIKRFDCIGSRHDDDPIAHEVREFLCEGGFVPASKTGTARRFCSLTMSRSLRARYSVTRHSPSTPFG